MQISIPACRIVNHESNADMPADVVSINIDDGTIRIASDTGAHRASTHNLHDSRSQQSIRFDAAGLLALPGIVDIHGDAFERQIQPRPGVVFDHALALADTDRQLITNGITTACHGLTYSWEGGLRGRDAANALLQQVAAGRERFAADHRIHLRFEVHYIDGLVDALRWIAEDSIDFVAFNDHLPSIAAKSMRPDKLAMYAERARCDAPAFLARMHAAQSGCDRVQGLIAAIAAACRLRGIPMASHDDETSSQRHAYHRLGVAISEFPRTAVALAAALDNGNPVILGAPNVILGGSHCGALSAADAVRDGACRILASDYYYPAMLQAPFRLAHLGVCSLAQAWALVSAHPAQALGLNDRGQIADGARADLLLVEPQADGRARLVATIAGGRLAYCAEPERMRYCHNIEASDYRMAA